MEKVFFPNGDFCLKTEVICINGEEFFLGIRAHAPEKYKVILHKNIGILGYCGGDYRSDPSKDSNGNLLWDSLFQVKEVEVFSERWIVGSENFVGKEGVGYRTPEEASIWSICFSKKRFAFRNEEEVRRLEKILKGGSKNV